MRWRGLQVIDRLLMRDAKKAKFGSGKDVQYNWDGTRLIGPAPNSGFWSDCPARDFADPNYAYTFFEDFLFVAYGDVTSVWTVDATGGTFLPGAGETVGLGGVAVLNVTNTDNNRANVKVSSTDTAAGMFKMTASSGKKLWFEARVKIVEAADETAYVGLIDGGCTRCGAADSGAANMTSGLYFRLLCASPTEIDWACFTTAEKEIKANIVANASAWMTLGFKFDGVTTVTPWINGVVGTDTVEVDDANFPNGVGLTPHLYLATGENVAKSLYVDWIKVVQTR